MVVVVGLICDSLAAVVEELEVALPIFQYFALEKAMMVVVLLTLTEGLFSVLVLVKLMILLYFLKKSLCHCRVGILVSMDERLSGARLDGPNLSLQGKAIRSHRVPRIHERSLLQHRYPSCPSFENSPA